MVPEASPHLVCRISILQHSRNYDFCRRQSTIGLDANGVVRISKKAGVIDCGQTVSFSVSTSVSVVHSGEGGWITHAVVFLAKYHKCLMSVPRLISCIKTATSRRQQLPPSGSLCTLSYLMQVGCSWIPPHGPSSNAHAASIDLNVFSRVL